MSDNIATNYGRVGLGQDVANTIEEMGSINFAQALRDFFPCRNMTPREYAKNHLMKRRVKFEYLGLGETIPQECPRGWDLLVVYGIAFSRRDQDDLAEHMAQAQTGKRVLLGIPLNAMSVGQQLRELCALRTLSQSEVYGAGTAAQVPLETRRTQVRKQLTEKVRKSLAPISFRWIYEGQVVEEAPIGNRNYFISGFLQTLYSASPRLNMGCSRRHCVEALNEILDLENTLQISNVARQGAVKVLHRFMINTGLLTRCEDFGGYSTYKISESIPNNEWGALWKLTIERFIGDGSAVRIEKLSTFCEEMCGTPWGVNRQVQALLLASLLRRVYPDITMEHDGVVVGLNGEALLRALANPHGWVVCYRPAYEHEVEFLNKFRTIFATKQTIAEGVFLNVWDRSLRTVTAWYHSLPGMAKLNRASMDVDTQAFVELITDTDKRENPHQLLGEFLPQLCSEDCVPNIEDQDIMLDWLRERRVTLEARVVKFQHELCTMLGEAFGAEPLKEGATVEWLDEIFRAWFKKLHKGTANCELSATAKALREVWTHEVDPEQRWLVLVPQKLGIPVINAWTRDMLPLYRARLLNACIEMQTWSLRDAMPWNVDELECKKELANWLSGMFDGMRLTKEQRESVLLDMLEDVM